MSQLHADCLNEIFEYLEDDKITLHSCLLVNHFWCEASVRILWRNYSNYSIQICNTLFACLPNESKDVLHNNGIIIPTQTSKPPLFNYVAFCKDLSINYVDKMIEQLVFRSQQSISSLNLNNNIYVAKQEIYRLFINQTFLKKLEFYIYNSPYQCFPMHPNFSHQKIIFTSYSGSNNCLKNLSELSCNSSIYSEFFYQLSQICHNIQSLNISISDVISNGLADLISVQKNLKYLNIKQKQSYNSLKDIIPSLTKLSNTLIQLIFDGNHVINNPRNNSLSFISKFINLQELMLFCYNDKCFNNFEDVILPQLQILVIRFDYPIYPTRRLFKFLENNGKSLKEFCTSGIVINSGYSDNSLNLTIAKFCPNLRKLHTEFINNEPETFKMVFNSCQNLESIRFWCGGKYSCLSENEALEVIMQYSHVKLCEIVLCHQYYVQSKLLPKELESFFASWKNSIPQRPSFSLIIFKSKDFASLDTNDENMKIIEKYIELDIIKKFKVEN